MKARKTTQKRERLVTNRWTHQEETFDSMLKNKDKTVKWKCWYEVQWDFNWMKINHFVKIKDELYCHNCHKDLRKQDFCYREISDVWLRLWMKWLVQMYLCCDCAVLKWKTIYWAKIVKTK